MKKFTLCFLAICSINVFGQPVLNSSDLNSFNVISNYFEASSTTVNSGAAGANVTWDFSTLALTASGTRSFETVATAPFSGSFPTANYFLKIDNSVYGYHNKTTTKLEIVGDSFETTVSENFPNPETIFAFPFTYNTTVNDTFQEEASSPVVSKTIIYDGYGTLITPFGTFTDCLRIKTTISGDSSIAYDWYKLNPFRSILGTYTSGNGTTSFDFYQATNLETTSFDKSNISIYPNPVSTVLNIALADNLEFDKILIQDISGKNVATEVKKSNTAAINVENFSSGLYFVSIFRDGENRTTKFLKH